HCKKAFKIDEAGYADILKQVRDKDFQHQLHERLELAEQEKETAIELATTKVASKLQKATADKDAEIKELKAKLESGEMARKLAATETAVKKDEEIQKLKAELNAFGVKQKLAITEAVSAIEKERDDLARELEAKDTEQKLLESTLKQTHNVELKSKD